MKRFTYILFFGIVLLACERSTNSGFIIPGKILFEPSGMNNYEIDYYHDGKQSKISLHTGDSSSFRNYKWFKGFEGFVAIEYQKQFIENELNDVHTYLTLLDLKGTPQQHIFNFPKHLAIHNYFPSRSGDKMAYKSTILDDKTALPAFTWVDIGIVDMMSGNVVENLPKVAVLQHLNIGVNPWSPGATKFIYAISHNSDQIVRGETKQTEIDKSKNKTPGLYVYDLKTKKNNLIVKDAVTACWSPVSQIIAFERNEDLFLYHIETGKEELLYDSGFMGVVFRFFWTPEGDYIYLHTGWEIDWIHMSNEKEILIDVGDKKEIPFQHLGYRSGLYSWKR